jgi:hypothetical protein
MTDAPPPEAAALPPDPAPNQRSADQRRLPGRVTAAAIILLVFGTLSALGGAVAILWSLVLVGRMGMMGWDRFEGGFGGYGGAGFLVGVMAVALAAAVAGSQLAAGWGVLQRLPWARILGMVVSAVALVLIVLGVLGTLVWVGTLPDLREFDRVPEWFSDWFRNVMTAGVAMGVLVSLVAGGAYAFVLVTLARAEEVFE